VVEIIYIAAFTACTLSCYWNQYYKILRADCKTRTPCSQ